MANGIHYSEPLLQHPDDVRRVSARAAILAGLSPSRRGYGLSFIQADNPAIGLVAVVEVGMSGVSSCEVTVREGQRVRKGEEIGMVHFGARRIVFCLGKG
jgi:phosphatidylserine decarboxylase